MERLYKRSGALALFFLAFVLQTYATGSLRSKSQLLQTNPCESGSALTQNTTWTKAQSPYVLSCSNFEIPAGITLTIEPGVMVIMPLAGKLTVKGTLTAIGAEGDSIVFTTNGTDKFDQLFIALNAVAAFDYFKIENAAKGLNLQSSTLANEFAGLSLNNGTIKNGTVAITVGSFANLSINNCLLTGFSGTAISANENATFLMNNCKVEKSLKGLNSISEIKIINCEFSDITEIAIESKKLFASKTKVINNSGSGIKITGECTIINCLIENNNIGVENEGFATITYSTIINNKQIGIRTNKAFNLLNYNNISGNLLNLAVTYNDVNNLNAKNNYWGTSVESEIRATIYDYWKENQLTTVDFVPFLLSVDGLIVPPTNLKLEKAGLNTIKFSWDDNSDNETSFVIERKQANVGIFVSIAEITDGSTTFEDTGLYFNAEYSYKVKAKNESNESEYITANFKTLDYISESLPNGYYKNFANAYKFADYDNDNDLDLLVGIKEKDDTDIIEIYKNIGNSKFELAFSLNITSSTVLIRYTELSWIDYNSDGYMDVAFSTQDGKFGFLKNTGKDNFEQVLVEHLLDNPEIGYIHNHSIGDFDNDGDSDILVLYGKTFGKVGVLKNTNAIFSLENINITHADFAANYPNIFFVGNSQWIDYNNDGYLDVLLSGSNNETSKGYFSIYENNKNGAFNTAIRVKDTEFWDPYNEQTVTDYNSDGLEDIFVATFNFFRLYTNNGDKTFTEKILWSRTGRDWYNNHMVFDFNNDGLKDVVLLGVNNQTELLTNNGGLFVLDRYLHVLQDFDNFTTDFADIDNDNDLDFVVSGAQFGRSGRIALTFSNNFPNEFKKPLPPTNLVAQTIGRKAELHWEKLNGVHTYNVFIRTATDTIVMPISNPSTGYLKQAKLGNAGYGNAYIINKLANGTYYWKVQTVSNNLLGGEWSEEQMFEIDGCKGFEVPKPEGYGANICQNYESNYIYAGGENIRWYNSKFEQVGTNYNYFPSTKEVGTFTYYATQTIDNCESSFTRVDLNVLELPSISYETVKTSTCTSSDGKLIITDLSKTTKIAYYSSDYISGQTGQSEFTQLKAGIYRLTAVAENSCFGFFTVKIDSEQAVEAPPASKFTVCNNGLLNTVKFDNNNTRWYNEKKQLYAENQLEFRTQETGSFIYLVTNVVDNCESDFTPVEITLLPTESFIADFTATTDCHTYDGKITISNQTDDNLIFSIDSGKTYLKTNSFTNLPSGSYLVYGKSANGCIATEYNNLQSWEATPVIQVSKPEKICYGDKNVEFIAQGENITWWSWGDVFLGSGNIYKPNTTDVSWWHSVEARANYGHCKSTSGFLDYVIYQLPISTFTGNKSICEGDKTILNAFTNYKFSWNPTESLKKMDFTAFEFSPKVTTTYVITLNDDGCETDAVITIEVNPAPDKAIISGPSEICYGQSDAKYITNAVPNSTHTWKAYNGTLIGNTNANEIKVNWLKSGTPQLSLIQTSTLNGCIGETVYKINTKGLAPDKVPTMLKGTNLLYIEDNKSNTYQWFKNNQEIPGETKQFYNVGKIDASAYYFCRSGYNNGCFTDSYPYGSVTGIENLAANQVRLYPNPSAGNFVIEFEEVQTLGSKIEIASISGKVLYTEHLPAGTNRFEINLNNRLAPGIYFLQIKNQGQTNSFAKLIIE